MVLDNSIIVAWCFEDEASDYADRAMESARIGVLLVPSIWPLEFANTLLVSERRNRISPVQRVRIILDIGALPITVEHESSERIFGEVFTLARNHQLSTYDASYLDLALRKGLPLATQDKALIRAAADCGVALFQP